MQNEITKREYEVLDKAAAAYLKNGKIELTC